MIQESIGTSSCQPNKGTLSINQFTLGHLKSKPVSLAQMVIKPEKFWCGYVNVEKKGEKKGMGAPMGKEDDSGWV